MPDFMQPCFDGSDGDRTEGYWARRSQVSCCREGTNAILFDPDRSSEKTINESGYLLWQSMDGCRRIGDLAEILARFYEIPVSEEVKQDTWAFADEMLRDGFVEIAPIPRNTPIVPELVSSIDESPRDMDLSLTGTCNLKCEYCFYADEMTGRRDLPGETWIRFFSELKSLAVRNVTLSGGEVLIREDMWELIDALIEARMRYRILSNGTMISEQTIAHFFGGNRRTRLSSIQVSIDGSCPAIHDLSRGRGSFVKAMRGLRLLKEAGLPVTVRVTVNQNNVDDLERIAALLLDEIGLSGFSTNDAVPIGMGCRHEDRVSLSPEQRSIAMKRLVMLDRRYPGRISASAGSLALWRMFHEMEEARKTGVQATNWRMGYLSSCGCMFYKLAVHHDGTIVPCNMLASASLGVIGQTPLKQIWREHPMLVEMRARRNVPMNTLPGCRDCEWNAYCSGGCPSVEFTRHGNLYLGGENSCYRQFIAQTGGLPVMD